MNARLLLNRGLVCWVLSLSVLSVSVVRSPGQAAPGKDAPAKPDKKDRKKLQAMIDALANRNSPPKLVRDGPYIPLYPRDYDWKEEERVRSALWKLDEEKTPEMWDELLRHIGDRRYCVTIKDENETFASGNLPVGRFCARFASEWLYGVRDQHLPAAGPDAGFLVRIPRDPKMPETWEDWQKLRAHKEFYELQIMVCEEAVRGLAKVKGVPQGEKDAAREKIEAEIAALRKTKRPIFTNFRLYDIRTFSPKEAERWRKEWEEAKKK